MIPADRPADRLLIVDTIEQARMLFRAHLPSAADDLLDALSERLVIDEMLLSHHHHLHQYH